MNWGLLFFALLAIALGVVWLAKQSRAATAIPPGRVIYADTTRWRSVQRPLYSRTHRLTGRPDYVLKTGRDVIPVEVKSGKAPPDGPYFSHILQLAAYCLLVQEAYEHRPPYGLIHYAGSANQVHEIEYSATLENGLMTTLDAMRSALASGGTPRDHDQVARCNGCSFHDSCDQSLA